MTELVDSSIRRELQWRELREAEKGGFNFDNSIRNELINEVRNYI